MKGLCYVLSEAFYHLYGKKFNLKPYRLRFHGVCHWWLQSPDGTVIDLTASQYKRPFPYARGRAGGFLTKEPCKRTKKIMEILG